MNFEEIYRINELVKKQFKDFHPLFSQLLSKNGPFTKDEIWKQQLFDFCNVVEKSNESIQNYLKNTETELFNPKKLGFCEEIKDKKWYKVVKPNRICWFIQKINGETPKYKIYLEDSFQKSWFDVTTIFEIVIEIKNHSFGAELIKQLEKQYDKV